MLRLKQPSRTLPKRMTDERDDIEGAELTGDVSEEQQLPDDAAVDVDEVSDSAESGNEADEEAVESLRELVSFLVQHLVDDPDAAEITLERRGSSVYIQLRLPEDDLGKVIGRGGRIAKAIRTVLLIAGSRHHLRVSLDIES
jgi:predicted RNA-binding protein YlqC (UPF0109 family)